MSVHKKKLTIPNVWLTVYSDYITNQTLFFIMLFASILIAFKRGYSPQEFKDYMRGVSSAIHQKEDINRMLQTSARQFLELEGISGIRLGEEELRIVLPEPVLFDIGKAKLKDKGKKILTEVGKTLALTRYNIVVEGHSCDLPINQTTPAGKKRWQLALERSTGLGPYYSNRELSGARALQVVQFFIKENLISPERLSASAYGPSMPLVPNINEENRIKNRRIEIKITVTESEKT